MRYSNLARNTALLALAVGTFSGGCSFAQRGRGGSGVAHFSSSPAIPAAEGSVSAGRDRNKNTNLTITVQHMARPERLTPPAATYVVWLQPAKEAPPQNIGALEVDKHLTGRLRAVTPYEQFQVFITTEAAAVALHPSGPALMWANVSP